MKIQEIRRNGSKYYHIYLPKNIIENVLHWKGKDTLIYHVANDMLILKKDVIPSGEWQNYLNCKICYNPTIIIKLINNPLRRQYSLVARCPLDHTIIKTSLPANQLNNWKGMILPQIYTCDICNGILLEEKRKFVRSSIGFRVHLRLFCRDCFRHRIKVIAQEIWDELHLHDSDSTHSPPISPTSPSKRPAPHCPTCEEPISPEQSFCGQCGTCLFNK